VVGAPDPVMARGKVVAEGGRLVGSPGDGRSIRRAPFGAAFPVTRGAAAWAPVAGRPDEMLGDHTAPVDGGAVRRS